MVTLCCDARLVTGGHRLATSCVRAGHVLATFADLRSHSTLSALSNQSNLFIADCLVGAGKDISRVSPCLTYLPRADVLRVETVHVSSVCQSAAVTNFTDAILVDVAGDYVYAVNGYTAPNIRVEGFTLDPASESVIDRWGPPQVSNNVCHFSFNDLKFKVSLNIFARSNYLDDFIRP